ncbi:hypothetical protein JCM11641_007697 [Rhodosporidiobolus odoratus]
MAPSSFSSPSLSTSLTSTPASSAHPSPALSLARLAFVSPLELEAALVRERDAAKNMCVTCGKGGKSPEAEVEEVEKVEWRAAVGPRSGRKIGAALRRSVSGMEEFAEIPKTERSKMNLADFTEAFDNPSRVRNTSSSSCPLGTRSTKNAFSTQGLRFFASFLTYRRSS